MARSHSISKMPADGLCETAVAMGAIAGCGCLERALEKLSEPILW